MRREARSRHETTTAEERPAPEWPPVLWLLVYIGSVFVPPPLNGANGKWDPLELALVLGLAAVACALAL
jgi:hypothetical protein